MNAGKSNQKKQTADYGEIRRQWKAGKKAREIAAALNCSTATVFRAIRKAGAEFRALNCRRNFAADKESQVRAMTAAGKNVSEIAQETGLSEMTIYNFWHRNGLRPIQAPKPKKRRRVKKEITAEQREIVLDIAGRAGTWTEIQHASGLSLHECELVLKEADLWPKPVNEAREDIDPPWWPEPGAPEYPDDFILKPEHRARLNEVRQWRLEGKPMTERNRKTKEKEGSEWKT